MKRPVAVSIILFLAACGASEIDHLSENNRIACTVLVEEMRTASQETLNLLYPLEVRSLRPCMCGVLSWQIVGSDDSTAKICLESVSHWNFPEPRIQRFGLGTCHAQPDDIMFPVGSAEETALISAFSLWMLDEFSLEEIVVGAASQPESCLIQDYRDPAATAAVLLQIFDRDPERFRLAHEILTCND